MTLNDILISLANQELKTSNIVNKGAIKDEHVLGVVGHINSALIDLFGKFELKVKQLTIQTDPSTVFYKLTQEYANTYQTPMGETSKLFRHIIDSNDDPFRDDIVKIKYIYDSKMNKLPINDSSDPRSVFIISHNEIQLINNNRQIYNIEYQARHPQIIYPADIISTVVDPTTQVGTTTVTKGVLDTKQKIDIHHNLYEALRVYVASKVLESIGGVANIAIASRLTEKYASTLRDLLYNGVIRVTAERSENKASRKGFP